MVIVRGFRRALDAFTKHPDFRGFGSAVPTGKCGVLAFLPQVSVAAVFLDWHTGHLGCGSAVDVAACAKQVEPPLFTGQSGDDACFSSGEVRDDELVTFAGDECGAHKLAERVRHRVVDQLDGVESAGEYKFARMGEIG